MNAVRLGHSLAIAAAWTRSQPLTSVRLLPFCYCLSLSICLFVDLTLLQTTQQPAPQPQPQPQPSPQPPQPIAAGRLCTCTTFVLRVGMRALVSLVVVAAVIILQRSACGLTRYECVCSYRRGRSRSRSPRRSRTPRRSRSRSPRRSRSRSPRRSKSPVRTARAQVDHPASRARSRPWCENAAAPAARRGHHRPPAAAAAAGAAARANKERAVRVCLFLELDEWCCFVYAAAAFVVVRGVFFGNRQKQKAVKSKCSHFLICTTVFE